jgi:hypothetical protein
MDRGVLSSKTIESFGTLYNNIIKGVSGTHYFSGLGNEVNSIDTSRVPALTATAIGDLMIRENDKSNSLNPEVISFKEFIHRYKRDPEFKEWLSSLDKIINSIAYSKVDLKWNRLVILYSHIHMFMHYLEVRNKSIVTKLGEGIRKTIHGNRDRPYISLDEVYENLIPTVKQHLLPELESSGYRVPTRTQPKPFKTWNKYSKFHVNMLKFVKCPKCGNKFSYEEGDIFMRMRTECPHPDYRGENEYYQSYGGIKCPKCGVVIDT